MASLSDIRTRLLDQVDTDPAPSADFVRRVNLFIRRAYDRVFQDSPYLFFETEIVIRTQPVVESVDSTDLLVSYVDAQVAPLEAGAYDASPANRLAAARLVTELNIGQTSQTWKYDRSWDGRDLELIDPSDDSVVHRCKVAWIWRMTNVAAAISTEASTDIIHIGLSVPLDLANADILALASSGFKYRIYTREYPLPHEIVEFRSGRLIGQNILRNLDILGRAEAEGMSILADFEDQTADLPRYIIDHAYHQPLPTPRVACSLTAGDVDSFGWNGPEPPGTFSYVYTYAWGKRPYHGRSHQLPYMNWQGGVQRDNYYLMSDIVSYPARNRVREPLYESPPSPVSAEYTVDPISADAVLVGGVKMQFEPINYLLGYSITQEYGDTGASGNATGLDLFSGLHIRIYRRRHSVDFSNYEYLGDQKTRFSTEALLLDDGPYPVDDNYYLLAEIPSNNWVGYGNMAVWHDQGQILPDRTRKLQIRSGYRHVRLHPVPDDEYNVSVRALVRPEPLETDGDMALVPEDATDLVVFLASYYFYEHYKEFGAADRAMARYEQMVMKVAARYGDFRPDNQPIYRSAARPTSWGGRVRRLGRFTDG